MDRQYDKYEIDLVDLLYYLKKKIFIIIAVVLVCAVIGCLYSVFFVTPEYTAEARLYVRNQNDGEAINSTNLQISTYLLQDYKVLITGKNVTEEVIGRLQLNMAPAALAAKIKVTAPENTRILQISVTDFDAQRAADITNTVCDVAAAQIESIMSVDAVKQIYSADVPQASSGNGIGRNTGLGFALGLIVSVAVLVVLYIFDDTIKTEEDVERRLGLTVLGVIPDSEDIHTDLEGPLAGKNRGIRGKR